MLIAFNWKSFLFLLQNGAVFLEKREKDLKFSRKINIDLHFYRENLRLASSIVSRIAFWRRVAASECLFESILFWVQGKTKR